MTVIEPTLELERVLLQRSPMVIGIDEVGRGALAGPVAVGVLAIDAARAREFPPGLRDSKLCTPRMRERLAPAASDWALASAVGWASAAEIDEFGIGPCLAAAAIRGLASLHEQGVDVGSAAILLDGSHDWLSPALEAPLDVTVRPKADRDCACVAGASVVAKVERDALMIELDAAHPAYGWAKNKGYGSQFHRDAIAAHGASAQHRRSWLSRILVAGQ